MKKEIKMKKICLVLAMVLAIALFPVFANGERQMHQMVLLISHSCGGEMKQGMLLL